MEDNACPRGENNFNMIFLKWHLGLGDAIICNGLVRELANFHKDFILLPCYPHNLSSVKYMFRDLDTVKVFEVIDDKEMIKIIDGEVNGFSCESLGIKIKSLGLGYYSKEPFDDKKWAEEFYRHAGVPWECRWSRFKADLYPETLSPIKTETPYAFVHNDTERNFCIKMENLPRINLVFPYKTNNIFDWANDIIDADEVHLINSSFLCLADSLPLQAKRKVLHQYARPDGVPPTLKEGWEILT